MATNVADITYRVSSGYVDIFMNLYLFAMDPKLLFKEALAFQELPDHGLTWRQIAILSGKHLIIIIIIIIILT